MAAAVCCRSRMDHLAVAEVIRGILARSPIFCDAMITEHPKDLEGQVAVDVSFGCGPTVFRVVAPSEDHAYSILYQLAFTMVEVDSQQIASC